MQSSSSSYLSDETKEDFSEMDDLLNTNIRLAQDNERLKETVQKLKSEQNEALEFATKNQELIVSISDLKMKLKETISEKTELQNRLEITLKSFEHLKEQTKENKEDCKTEDSLNLSKILQNEKNRLQQQIDEIQNDLTSKNDTIKSILNENNSLHESLNKILKLSSISFQRNFENEGDLISFLSSYHPEKNDENDPNLSLNLANTNQNNEDQTQQYLINQRIIKKITKLKKQLKKEKENNQEIQQELEKAKNANEQLKKSTLQQINKIKEELQEERHKSALVDIQHHAEIEKYKQENKRYYDQINYYQVSQNKTKIMDTMGNNMSSQTLNEMEKERIRQEKNSLQNNINQLTKQISDLRETNFNLKTQNTSILAKFKTLEVQNENYTNKIDKQKQEINSLSQNMEKFKSENQTLILEISQLQEQLGASNTKLSTLDLDNQQLKLEIDRLNLQIANYTKSVSLLEDNYQKQKCEAQEVYSYREKLTNLVRRQIDYFKLIQNNYQKLLQENNQLKNNIKLVETKLRQAQEESQSLGSLDPKSFPLSIWYNKGFPRDLCSKITEFVKNDALDNQTKLKNVLNEIMSYYTNQIKTIQEQLADQQNKTSIEHDAVESFFLNLSSLLDINLNIEVLLHDSSINERVTKTINDMKSTQYQIANEKSKVEGTISEFLTLLNVSSVNEGKEMIKKLYSNVELLQLEQAEYKTTQSKLKKIIKGLKNDNKNNVSNLQTNLEEKEKDNEALNQEKRELVEKVRSLNHKICQMEIQVKTVSDNSLQQYDQLKADNELEIQSIKNSYEQQIRKLQIANDQKAKDISNLQDKINELEKLNDQWKHSSESFEAVKRQNEKQVKELMEQHEQHETEMKKSHTLEKQNLRDQYERCLENIKQQNKDLQSSSEKTAQQLQEANIKVNELNQKLSVSENIIIDLKSRLQTQKEEIERERNLIEMRTKSSILAQEIKFNNAIDENKLNYQSEKRKIFEFIANLFSEYCDVKSDIDEFAFRSILQSVRKDLSQLSRDEKTIRTILSISDRESLPDAISKLVLNIFAPCE